MSFLLLQKSLVPCPYVEKFSTAMITATPIPAHLSLFYDVQRSRLEDPQEGLGWYLLGRCYMAAQKHKLAYAAYEQAV